MRILFLSSVVDGGSGRSQRELVRRLRTRGHDVRLLVDDGRPARPRRWIGEHLADASERFASLPGLRWLEARPGARTSIERIDGLDHRVSTHPQNALPSILADFDPEIVVGNSVARFTWRRSLDHCRAAGVPTVLYLREVAAIGHLDIEPAPADVLVANARSLAERAEALGHRCAFVPSVIDTSPTRTESVRTHALFVNPIETHGIDLLCQVARRCADIPFVVQESWPLDPETLDLLNECLASLPNVEFRGHRPPGPHLYADARVLLVPHRIDNRPRVIVEAQANAIPALVSTHAGLVEAAGTAGVAIDEDDVAAWADELVGLWTDEASYGALVEAAEREGQRPELDPDHVVGAFEDLLAQVGTAPKRP
ncbi:MAG: glycosyltransferase [Actinomycetota bacterium]